MVPSLLEGIHHGARHRWLARPHDGRSPATTQYMAARRYPTISLSCTAGDRGDRRHAAVIIKRAQPAAEKQPFGMDATTFQTIRCDGEAGVWTSHRHRHRVQQQSVVRRFLI